MDTLRYIRAVQRPQVNFYPGGQQTQKPRMASKPPAPPLVKVTPHELYTIDENSLPDFTVLSPQQYEDYVKCMRAEQTPVVDGLVVLSTSELELLNATILKKIEVKRQYIPPPNTPAGTEAGQYFDQQTKEQLKNAKDTDLRELLRSQPAWHVVSITNDPTLFDTHENMSDYYHMPIIEDPRSGKFELTLDNLSISSDSSDSSDSGNSDSDNEGNVSKPPRHTSHPKSIILYLFGKGQSEWQIAKILGFFEAKFFEPCGTPAYRDVIIPPHWEMNDQTVAWLREICVPEENLHPWWEGKIDKQGLRIPETFRQLHRLARARPITLMVEETVEEYLYYRLANL